MNRWYECKKYLRSKGFSNKYIRNYFNIPSPVYGDKPAWKFAKEVPDGYKEVLGILYKVYG